MTQSIRILNPWFLALDNNGRPAEGYLVWTLEAGTVATLVDTYQDKDLLVLNTNPVVLDFRGACLIFTDLQYLRLVFTAPDGDLASPIWVQDYVQGATQGDLGAIGASVGMTNNIYTVNVVPSYATIPDGFSLVMIPDATNLDTIIGQTFTGTGINDIVFTGPFNGTTPSTFEVQIDDGTSNPNTIKWRKDSGAYTTSVPLTAGKQYLTDGISFQSSEIIGHTLGDLWTLQVRTPVYVDFCGLGPDLVYKNVAGALTVLDGGDIIQEIPAHLDRSASQSCWILINPSLPELSDLPRVIHRREVTGDSGITSADAGNEVSYTGTGGHTLTLPNCADVAGFPFDITSSGNLVTVQTVGGDLIILPEATTGVTSVALRSDLRTALRLLSNGANWHALSDTQIPHGSVELADGDTWVCPVNVTIAWLTGCPGGGGGASNGTGGEVGWEFIRYEVTVVPGTSYAVVIGSGGTPGSVGGHDGGVGGSVSFGALLSLTGGAGGTTGGTPAAGADSLSGRGGALGSGTTGGNANGHGAGGGGSDNNSNQGGAGSPARLFLEW